MIQENLNKENFWNEMYQKYPLATGNFCKWIDEYKNKNNWKILFNDSFHISNKTYDKKGKLVNADFSAPKFHDLPIAMQMGIWREYLEDELNIESCKTEIESYLYGAQEGISQFVENLKNKEIIMTLTPNQKAKELKAQFGDNAKYVVLEIMDELKKLWNDFDSQKMFGSSNPILERINFYQSVKTEIENYLHAAEEGISQVAENLKNEGLI